jgi:hypothetical protein
MNDEENPNQNHYYQIRITGHLSQSRINDFEGMQVTLLPNSETLISGRLKDQAELFGILIRIRDLGIPLLSLTSIEPEQEQTFITNQNRRPK